MNENLIENQYDINKKSRLKKFYETNKTLIFLSLLAIVIIIVTVGAYSIIKENKKIYLAESYIEAKVSLESSDRNKAKEILKTMIFENDSTYSTLAFFLIIKENLIVEQKEISDLFDHILKNNKYEKEIENLIIFKHALFQSDYVSESEVLETLNPLINSESIWKAHALLLIGDYFSYKKEYLKAKEFYMRVLSIKNLQRGLYEHAHSQLMIITND